MTDTTTPSVAGVIARKQAERRAKLFCEYLTLLQSADPDTDRLAEVCDSLSIDDAVLQQHLQALASANDRQMDALQATVDSTASARHTAAEALGPAREAHKRAIQAADDAIRAVRIRAMEADHAHNDASEALRQAEATRRSFPFLFTADHDANPFTSIETIRAEVETIDAELEAMRTRVVGVSLSDATRNALESQQKMLHEERARLLELLEQAPAPRAA